MNIIEKEYFNQFCLTGFIKQGVASVDDQPVSTWAMTSALQEEYDFYFKDLTEKEKIIATNFAPVSFR